MRIALGLPLVAALAGCSPWTSPQAGRALYEQNCATCHGADARGGAQVPDLTQITARAGGTYPQMRILDKLDGYAQGQTAYAGAEMPNFGDLLTGRLSRVQTPSGLSRPLPEKIVALDAYLQTIQR
ncbi:c-type cytochrome [Natronohydrobacter thiooxidans]|jgi:mono/diheme cytochrome c family protein|uniref:c-type cytochrome n=1 Tax=Natronohydrobacter thiooxidans TaxID=87172 RepID=UPI0008FF7008|nr:cytochrome c [Natronohydrobacter thiooxidans]